MAETGFMSLVQARKSVRSYSDKPVEEEKLVRILEAARLAPSWANKQPWSYVVVKDSARREEVAKACGLLNTWLKKAPVIIVACADPRRSGRRNGMDYYLVDMGISMEHLVLAAADQGLGTCWIGYFDEQKIKQALSVPEDMKVVTLSPVGYPDEGESIRSRMTRALAGSVRRKPLEEIVHRDKW